MKSYKEERLQNISETLFQKTSKQFVLQEQIRIRIPKVVNHLQEMIIKISIRKILEGEIARKVITFKDTIKEKIALSKINVQIQI